MPQQPDSELTAAELENLRLRVRLRGSLTTATEIRIPERDLLLVLAGFPERAPGTVAKVRTALGQVLGCR